MRDIAILRQDEQAGFQLRELYRRRGYVPYRMSKFEEYDLYVRNKSFLVSENVLTFTDTDGRLMALKPDVTLSIVKNTPDEPGATQKVCYHETVYRTSPAAAGYREIMQAGLECIGELDSYTAGEILALAEESLALISGDYLLDVSHMGVAAGLLEEVAEETARDLLEELGRKNTAAIRDICARRGLPRLLSEHLEALALLYGRPEEVLPRLRDLAQGPTAEAAVRELEEVCALLAAVGRDSRLRLDFSIVNDMRYYSGLIFRGYLPGLASGVLSGGRYDNLLHRMGRRGGAMGFAVYLDQLERLETETPAWDIDTLLLYGPEDRPADVAARAAAILAQGRSVRAARRPPQGVRFRTTERLGEGEEG